MRKGEEEQGARVLHALSCVLLGGAVGLLCCLVLLLICAACVTQGLLGEDAMGRLTVCVCLVGALVGGRVAVRQIKERALIVGLCTGAVLFLFQLTLGVLLFDGVALTGGGLPQALGCLVGGALAGLLGRRPKKRRRK